ncbi:hypothetical protein GCM10027612_48720 [Microbispora bryophytorum subsp. camponoti]
MSGIRAALLPALLSQHALWCGVEEAIRRLVPHEASRTEGGAIIPVLWVPVPDSEIPQTHQSILAHALGLGQKYFEYGIYGLMKLRRNRADYELAVHNIARQIIDAAGQVKRQEMASHLGDYPKPPTVARQLASWAASAAIEPERDEEWRQALSEIAATGTRREAVLYAAGILYAGLHSRLTWIARQATRPGVACLRWLLRSQFRSRMLTTALLLWAGLDTAADTGLGAAIVVVLTGVAGLELLAKVLRVRFGIRLPDESDRDSPE